ncbi:MAG: RNB domain-containing ribonuclease [Vicinamibacterales bacterium]
MGDASHASDRSRLRSIAIRAMRERGLDPDFSSDAIAQAEQSLETPPPGPTEPRDLRALLWCSIDNDDSRDLDQLSMAEAAPGDGVKVRVAIADVDAQVTQDSPIDRHAAVNTTSVYTPAVVFPMLPLRLSTDLTSLNAGEDRLAIVVEITVAPDGAIGASDVYRATVRNHAKLAYRGVGAWLAGQGPLPGAAAAVPGLDALLTLQDRAAQALSERRHEEGALEFDRIEANVEFEGDALRDVHADEPNRAKALIENFMVAANGVTARFLDAHKSPSIRRVVRQPKRWSRIVEIAAATGGHLPAEPDARALAEFLRTSRRTQPDRFADLSLSVIKLLGPGEYVVDRPGEDPPGHFGLAVKDYAHSTAPNRRYPDLLTQRLIKAALAGKPSPYSIAALERLAIHCTLQEDAANKVERQVDKSAAALVMAPRIGQAFEAIVTGASPKGTFVRVFAPPVEGMLAHGVIAGVDVGDRLRVKLDRVDVERGFIDFSRA